MSVIERAFHAWHLLAPKWSDYLLAAGLDLTKTSRESFANDMLRRVSVNFRLRGLEDFCRSACRGIEPGDPPRSLLYHVLASPGVMPDGIDEGDYPDPAHIQAIENLVYGIIPPSLEELKRRAQGRPLAIVVFAYEYAPASDTVHKRHADLCFSRTGVSRIGNKAPRYMARARGYLPFSDAIETAVHVVPCRFGAFMAATWKGDPTRFGPARFQDGDEERDFWVPLHKLFDGPDCIDGFNLRVHLRSQHVNEKIRRIHLALEKEGVASPWTAAELRDFPFRISKGIANLGRGSNDGLLIPACHNLVELAKKRDGTVVFFHVPPKHASAEGALWFKSQRQARRSPELVHVQHEVVGQSVRTLLNRKAKTVNDIVQAGKYKAVNFVDYTADGWVEANCSALTSHITTRLAAYSLVSQPDFFPLVKQSDLLEWWGKAPAEIKDNIWPYQHAPLPLSDNRIPVTITLRKARFDSHDETMTAVVGLPRPAGRPVRIRPFVVQRESTLPFRATGLFSPGWDCSTDFNNDVRSPNGVLHLANYGTGSPFMEDTMICAAHGSFWPAASPDTTRFFAPGRYPSVTPILDSEAGWDQVPLARQTGKRLEFRTLVYTDYVQLVLDRKLAYARFARTPLAEYVARTLALARVFQVLRADKLARRLNWSVLDFERATANELCSLPSYLPSFDVNHAYKVHMAKIAGASKPVPGHFELGRVTTSSHEVFYASPNTVARRGQGNRHWKIYEF